MIILIDNYDSFTFNLYQYLGDLGASVEVHRNDKISVGEVLAKKPEAIVISPGPSDPDHAGLCLDLLKENKTIPLLGVCLGMQAMGQAFGGCVVRAPAPMHGKISSITHNNTSVFKGLPSPLEVARYHSLVVERHTLPDTLQITAQTNDNLIMGLQHKTLPIHGVQFHPESIVTQHGHAMLKNFLDTL
jgi:anthranilate synthase component 2